MKLKIQLPAIYAVNVKLDTGKIQQLIHPKRLIDVAIEPYDVNRVKGYVLTSTKDSKDRILAIYNQAKSPNEFNKVLRIKPDDFDSNFSDSTDLTRRKWERHPKLLKVPKRSINYDKRLNTVRNSWSRSFSYKSEDRNKDIKGLRPPQIGAVHAAHAHWSVSAATIVMPTGTGKTETMLSILVSNQCEKLLVVVPTAILREQIAEKFLTLGILKDFGIVTTQGLYPIVGILNHRPKNCNDVDMFFEKCNVVITTMQIAGQCGIDIQERMAYHCSYLFIT